MKKYVIGALCAAILAGIATGCGGPVSRIGDYNYAEVKMADGKVISGKIENITYFSNDSTSGFVEVDIAGKSYAIHSSNVWLTKK